LSVAVITLNEERDLARCLEAVRGLAAETVVVDSGSTDKTGEVARAAGATFVTHPWSGFGPQRTVALSHCWQPWVLFLDADEVVSAELAGSLRALFAGKGPAADAYQINRRAFYLGAWLWHAWSPDWCLRLVRKDAGEWGGYEPHPEWRTKGVIARLTGDLQHYSYRDLHDHLRRTIHYARVTAESYAREGRQARWYHLLFSPALAALRVLVLKQAWRDGWRGWVVAGSVGVKTFAKYAFLAEHQRATTPSAPGKPTDRSTPPA
jgi:glycosyltransferase involved in cell wall biosynthesis